MHADHHRDDRSTDISPTYSVTVTVTIKDAPVAAANQFACANEMEVLAPRDSDTDDTPVTVEVNYLATAETIHEAQRRATNLTVAQLEIAGYQRHSIKDVATTRHLAVRSN